MKRSPDIIAFPAILPQISGNLWESKLCLLWHLFLSFWLFRNINDRSRAMYPHFSRKKELLLLCYSSHFTVKINISMSSFFYPFFQVEQSALSEEDSNLFQKLFRCFYMWKMFCFFNRNSFYRWIDILYASMLLPHCSQLHLQQYKDCYRFLSVRG